MDGEIKRAGLPHPRATSGEIQISPSFAQGQAEAERLREQRERAESRGTAEARALARARTEKAGLTRLPRQATAAASELLDRTA